MPDLLPKLSFLLGTAILLAAAIIGPAPATAQDEIFISSRGSHEIRIYDAATGDFLRTLTDALPGQRERPQEVLFGPEDGLLYVTFRGGEQNDAIHQYDPVTGDDLGNFSSGYSLDQPTKMRIGPDGHFYVSQWGNANFNVAVFDGESGECLREATNDTFRRNLMGMAWDDDGRLYVSHWGNGQNGFVRRFDVSGDAIETVIGSSSLQGPVNIWFNEDGTLNVVDWTRGRVDAFDVSSGETVRSRASGMQRSEGWTFGPDDYLYVCDWQNGDINRYNPDTGEFVDTFIDDPGLVNPNSIAFRMATDVAIEDDVLDAPTTAVLKQNYPNPFNPSTRLSYSLSQTSSVSVVVTDLLGREVARLVDGVQPAGAHTVQFDAGDLPSGIYIYRLITEETSLSRVMTLLK